MKEEEKRKIKELKQALEKLKNISWFKNSVADIRVFRVEDWSDFTQIVKN